VEDIVSSLFPLSHMSAAFEGLIDLDVPPFHLYGDDKQWYVI